MSEKQGTPLPPETLPEGMSFDLQTGMVGYGTRYGESSQNGRPAAVGSLEDFLGHLNGPLPQRFFVDTCFLMNLVQYSAPRRTVEESDSGGRHEMARARWDEFLARRAHNPQMRAFWSPIVLQEFTYACARAMFQLYQRSDSPSDPGRKSTQLEAHDHERLLETINLAVGREGASRYSLLKRSAPPPQFIKAVLPLIRERISGVIRHLTMVPDSLSIGKETTLHDYFELLNWGTLGPADCIVILTARNAGSEAILTDDHQFLDSAEMLAKWGLRVLT